jgi:hypothetical protein
MFLAFRPLAASALALTLALPAAAAEPPASSPAPAAAQPPGVDAPVRTSAPFLRGHRYAFAAGGVLLLGGIGTGFFARGEARRANSLESAREASSALHRARTASATANVMYGVAGLTLAYGLVLELLPEPAADAASLTYHF